MYRLKKGAGFRPALFGEFSYSCVFYFRSRCLYSFEFSFGCKKLVNVVFSSRNEILQESVLIGEDRKVCVLKNTHK